MHPKSWEINAAKALAIEAVRNFAHRRGSIDQIADASEALRTAEAAPDDDERPTVRDLDASERPTGRPPRGA